MNGDCVFTKKEVLAKLESLFKDHCKHNQEGLAMFSFTLTLAPKKKLTGKKLKEAIEDYHNFTPGMSKKIKEEVETNDPYGFDDGTTRHSIGTKVWKVFGGLEYEGTIIGYIHKQKWYHILYNDGDTEDFYHNKVKDHLKPTRSKKFQWKKAKMNHLKAKFAPKEIDYLEHVMTLDVGTI